MAGEKSHGKARPRLPRASDLHEKTAPPGAVARTEAERTRQRDASGRFACGNALAIGRGAKAGTRRMLGRSVGVTDADVLQVTRDAERLYNATLRELPHDGVIVRQIVALLARHTALAAYWSARASAAGLGTDEGVKAAAESTRHGQRAERLSITALDVAKDLARMTEASRPDAFEAMAAKWNDPK